MRYCRKTTSLVSLHFFEVNLEHHPRMVDFELSILGTKCEMRALASLGCWYPRSLWSYLVNKLWFHFVYGGTSLFHRSLSYALGFEIAEQNPSTMEKIVNLCTTEEGHLRTLLSHMITSFKWEEASTFSSRRFHFTWVPPAEVRRVGLGKEAAINTEELTVERRESWFDTWLAIFQDRKSVV